MIKPNSDHIVVLFADVSGSTRMYEQLGDTVAHDCIRESLDRISQHVDKHNGILVETIGDEAMVTFESVDDAIIASLSIQQHFFQSPIAGKHFVKVRIGFHFGPIEYDQGHPFGDTVNVAARVVALCEAGRIISTRNTLALAENQENCQFRQYQKARVKGKSNPLTIEEVVCDNSDATSLFNMTQATQVQSLGIQLLLGYQGQTLTLTQETPTLVLGRGEHCDLVIDNSLASRAHAKVEYRWGDLVLTDHSTNGTYLYPEQGKRKSDGKPMRLHRREMILRGKGKIVIGVELAKAEPSSIIEYEVVRPDSAIV